MRKERERSCTGRRSSFVAVITERFLVAYIREIGSTPSKGAGWLSARPSRLLVRPRRTYLIEDATRGGDCWVSAECRNIISFPLVFCALALRRPESRTLFLIDSASYSTSRSLGSILAALSKVGTPSGFAYLILVTTSGRSPLSPSTSLRHTDLAAPSTLHQHREQPRCEPNGSYLPFHASLSLPTSALPFNALAVLGQIGGN